MIAEGGEETADRVHERCRAGNVRLMQGYAVRVQLDTAPWATKTPSSAPTTARDDLLFGPVLRDC